MSETLRVFIVEDERAAREELKFLLERHPEVEVVGEAGDGRSALAAILEARPDLVFLDIRIPCGDGLDLARRIRQKLPSTQVVFATAFDEHAVEAFDLAATDYLLKPFDAARLARSLERARKAHHLPERLAVERLRRTFFLDPKEIAWIGMQDGLVTVAGIDGIHYTTNQTLRELTQHLDPAHFFRCHREAIVNLQQIREVKPHLSGTYRLVLRDEPRSKLPLARNRVRSLKAIMPW